MAKQLLFNESGGGGGVKWTYCGEVTTSQTTTITVPTDAKYIYVNYWWRASATAAVEEWHDVIDLSLCVDAAYSIRHELRGMSGYRVISARRNGNTVTLTRTGAIPHPSYVYYTEDEILETA